MNPERFKIGTSVRALHDPARDRGYIQEHRAARQRGTGLTGIVIAEHDSHGLCYEVRFRFYSGAESVITYDREELEDAVRSGSRE